MNNKIAPDQNVYLNTELDHRPYLDHPNYRRWISEFIRALFDLSFSEVITLKMLPLVYGLAMIALAMGTIYLFIDIFLASPWRGIFYLVFIAPVFFIFGTAAIRSVLEFFSAVFRIRSLMIGMNTGLQHLEGCMGQLSEQMKNMNHHIEHMSNAMTHMQKDFNSVVHVMENIEGLTDRIPFLKKQRRPTTREEWAESSLNTRSTPDDAQDTHPS